MRVVAEVRPGILPTGIRAVVRHVYLVNVPGPRRIRRLADRQVEVIDEAQALVVRTRSSVSTTTNQRCVCAS